MKEIPLTQGQVTLVDDADFDWLNQWKWYAIYQRNTQSFYAVRGVRVAGKVVRIWMARLILGLDQLEITADHQNGNTLDNQRLNLRAATNQQNVTNSKMRWNNQVGLKGVSPCRRRFKAQITVNGKKLYLGLFLTPELAAEAYRKKALEVHGEFARL